MSDRADLLREKLKALGFENSLRHFEKREEDLKMCESKKVYLVIDTPHGDFNTVYGIFTSEDKAEEVCTHYSQTLFTGPYVKEIVLDVEKDWWSSSE